jgi:hypothetical protein
MLFEHPAQLNALTPLLVPRRESALRLGGTMADHPKRVEWERDLNRAYRACGCDTGAAGMIAGTFLGVALTIAMVLLDRWTLLSAAGVVFLFAFAGAAAGKFAGVVHARARLKRLVREIQTLVGV